MTNLYFIHRFPFTKEAYIRDEFDYFLKLGYNVKYLDVSQFLKKKKLILSYAQDLEKHVISFKSKQDFKNFIHKNKKNSLIISDVGFRLNSAWLYINIFKNNIPYVLFENAVLPKVDHKSMKLGFIKFLARFDLKKIYQKPIELLCFYYANLIKRPATSIISSKEKVSSSKRPLLGKDTNIKYTASLDFISASSVDDNNLIKEPYAVFIDQYFIHHPDFKTNHIIHHFTAEQYYGELNQFLNQFSKQTGLKIVIAAHPRRINTVNSNFNSDFDLYYNKTAQLVKYAEVSLIHFSTAINYSVIYNKPFILLGSDCFSKSSVKEEISAFANFFEVNVLNATKYLNHNIEVESFKSMNTKDKYTEFFNLFIKSPNAESITFKDAIEDIIQFQEAKSDLNVEII
ncbi:hypothetical protein [Plebeiibacterium sediminum]|uniref:Uncharacterized protein n=1 Tax=Plebeiibacterium sediminum TaxID=2992112 RepID=A0AAE3SDB5_9BACT|nr:hypothetical protein [Plebeiobacterium sediminum]MCW3785158.1 hypothetical protein [Plebeiobacterium sediminum]